MIIFILLSLILGLAICAFDRGQKPWLVQIAYGISILASVTIAAKIVPIGGGYTVSASIGLFSMTFLLTDYLSEVHGKKFAIQALIGTALGYGIFLFATQMAVYVDAAPFWADNQEAYKATLGSIPRVMLASVLAFVTGQFTDITIFHLVKEKLPNLGLWARNNISTFFGQTIDTLVFYTVAFWGIVPDLFGLIIVTCVIKYIIAIVDTPVLYFARSLANSNKKDV